MAIDVIYIDVLFLVNFTVNLTILVAEALLLKIPAKAYRLIAGAILGAIYSCLVFSLNLHMGMSVFSKTIILSAITALSFGGYKLPVIIKRCIALWILTVVFAMLILGLLYFTDIGLKFGGMVKNGIFYFDIPLYFIFPACALALIITMVFEKINTKSPTRCCVTITVYHRDKKVSLKALVDTGNTLTDPFSGKGVVVAEWKTLAPILDIDPAEISEITHENLPRGFRIIPFSSVGEQNGILPAFVPDKVRINGEFHTDITTAIYSGTLSQKGDYNALIGPIEINRKDVTYA